MLSVHIFHRAIVAFIVLVTLSLAGCVEKFFPEEVNLKTGTLVVVAHLSSKPGVQSIYLSLSSTLIHPTIDVLSGCYVELARLNGDSREFIESEPGCYCCLLDEDFLITGEDYSLTIVSPDGERYESDIERLLPAPEIDSVYFFKEDHSAQETGEMEEGVQFYIDYEFYKKSARYLRWQLTETYEFHNPEHSAMIFDVDRIMKELPDSSSWRTCWITREIPEIFTRDLGNLEGTSYRQMPLTFVTRDGQRLDHRYSLLVRQFAMSKTAFLYWDELGKNLQSMGTLYDTQPAFTPGNICNVTDSEEFVIGYFNISGVSEKRIFVEKVPDLKIQKDPTYCAPGEYPSFLFFFPQNRLPVYLSIARVDGKIKTGQVNKHCVDCREYFGSSHIKPEFW